MITNFGSNIKVMEHSQLLQKYNVAAPRYTSYPTVPFWDNQLNCDQWLNVVKRAYQKSGEEGLSLYIHLPFCDSLCTYCGCTKHITRNHALEHPYIDAILKEWQIYIDNLDEKPLIREIHLGGGTPTFFSASELQRLIRGIFRQAIRHPQFEGSLEGHPNNTTFDHLRTLFREGFKRVSFGIQDFDLKVQEAIHRIQPLEKVISVSQWAREIGYESINFDLIYGLPHQSETSIRSTFESAIALRPDRIAFYNYAHVPGLFPSQKSYEAYLPTDEQKQKLCNLGREILRHAGYQDIGMDHFTLPTDELYLAYQNGNLHRNFMGYTIHKTPLLIGLGASAISDAHFAYHQNEKNVKQYQTLLESNILPHIKGHLLNKEDLERRRIILDIACKGHVQWPRSDFFLFNCSMMRKLEEMREEGLIHYNQEGLSVTEVGKGFIRNICSIFDDYLLSKDQKIFSKAI